MTMSETDLRIPRKKIINVGMIMAIMGLCGIALAAATYPTWQDNKDTLQINEIIGEDTPKDHRIVDIQTIAVYGGFFIGGILLLIGVALVVFAMQRKVA